MAEFKKLYEVEVEVEGESVTLRSGTALRVPDGVGAFNTAVCLYFWRADGAVWAMVARPYAYVHVPAPSVLLGAEHFPCRVDRLKAEQLCDRHMDYRVGSGAK